jgi:mRNA-degrading endonuclease RelE of RelBE toxin-antitoxin system
MTNNPPVRVDYADQFKKELKQLRKKYPHIQNDVQPLIDTLLNGETPGDQVPGIAYTVYKVRIRSTDQSKGKQGGYRVLYYIKTTKFIILLRIYTKSARSDLANAEIRSTIEEYEASEENQN